MRLLAILAPSLLRTPLRCSARVAIQIRLPAARALNTTAQPAPADKDCYLQPLKDADTGITVLNLSRAKAKNAISVKLLTEFREALQEVQFDGITRVLILRSVVDGVFCAGADLKERATMSPSQVSQFLYNLRQAFRDLEALSVPTIAVIDGAALGGGLEMALSCDIRVAGEDAKIGLTETKLAIIPGAGGTQRLPRLIGVGKAKELIFTGKILDSMGAHEYGMICHYLMDVTCHELNIKYSSLSVLLGIVNHSVQGSSFEKALSIAREILPTGPVAIKMAKQALDKGAQTDINTGLEIEQAYYAQVIPTEDRLEGLKAFKEKRAPVYKGR
ncbi:ClpP/crotonase-like domain-containing protein [Jimgerdemannia flammicorona]|uniref:ClpP/crotonase-like domain-containing protein n=1 Tax=Jimgerdemannia flammicorona TaxID=994334 RepID=A0A433QJN2_9FUNG|nr:ClpP/crotonase-like domain-containing protein [Jimgerdemannia flammicorona]